MSFDVFGLYLKEPKFPILSSDTPTEARQTTYDNNGFKDAVIFYKNNSGSIYDWDGVAEYPPRIDVVSQVYYRHYHTNTSYKVIALKIDIPAIYYNTKDSTDRSYNNKFISDYIFIGKNTFNTYKYWNDANRNTHNYIDPVYGDVTSFNTDGSETFNLSIVENSPLSYYPLYDRENKFKSKIKNIVGLPEAEYYANKIWNDIVNFCNEATGKTNGINYFWYYDDMPGFLHQNKKYNVENLYTTFPIYNLKQGEKAKKYFDNGTESLFDGTGTPENITDIKLATQDIPLNTNWNIYLNTSTMQSIFTWNTPSFSNNNIDTKTAYIQFFDDNGNYVTDSPYNQSKITFNINELNEYLTNQYKNNGYYILQFYVENESLLSSTGYVKIEPVITDYGIKEPNDGSTINIFYNKYPDYDTDYDDNKDNTDDDITNGSTVGGGESSYNALNVICRSYYITTSNLRSLSQFLWSDNFTKNIKLLNNDPIENIVSCKMLPFVLNGSSATVVCGNVDTGVNAESIANNYYHVIGSINIPSYYNNFLDYAPYTKLTIFLPFIGFKEIDCNLYIGKTLTVAYIHDIITGTCKAMLYSDNIYVQSFDGVSGIDIPLTASNNSQIANAFIGSAVGSVAQFFGDPIGGLLSLGKATVSSALATQHYSTQGSYSPSCGAYETHICYIIVDRPSMQYSKTYNHDYGRPCNLSQTIGNLKGFTKMCDNIDCSGISCTENEKEMIKQLLTSGIYV